MTDVTSSLLITMSTSDKDSCVRFRETPHVRYLIDGGVSGVGSSLCIDVQINAGNNLAIGAFGNKLRDEVTHFAAAAT